MVPVVLTGLTSCRLIFLAAKNCFAASGTSAGAHTEREMPPSIIRGTLAPRALGMAPELHSKTSNIWKQNSTGKWPCQINNLEASFSMDFWNG